MPVGVGTKSGWGGVKGRVEGRVRQAEVDCRVGAGAASGGFSLRRGPPTQGFSPPSSKHPSLLCPHPLQLFLSRPFCSGPSWASHFFSP